MDDLDSADSDRTGGLLTAFAAAVRASPHNLLSRRALEELESRHIAESTAFARSLPAGSTVLDLGTGGGFPGMVVAIVRPDLAVSLLDATAKKVEFLREFAENNRIDVTLLTGRAEELQQSHAGRFDVVTARAVAPLDQLVVWALPFLRPGGSLHAIKGERWKTELEAALPVIRQLRAKVEAVPGHESGDSAQVPAADPMVAPRVVIIRAPG